MSVPTHEQLQVMVDSLQIALTACEEERERQVERVAEALYERAMSERRSFSVPEDAKGFGKRWSAPPHDDLTAQSRPVSWRDGWRDEAREVLGLATLEESP